MGLEQYLVAENTGNICFLCRRACGDCSWSRDFTPVPGWTAKKVMHKINRGRVRTWEPTYKITACPQFVEG